MAGQLGIIWAATRLRLIASGAVDLADSDTLTKIVDLLGDYTPEERSQIGAKAVQLGADPTLIAALLNLASGEVINVSGRAPSKNRRWLWWVAGVAAVVGAGVVAYRHRRRKRLGRPLRGADDLATIRRLSPGYNWSPFNATTYRAMLPLDVAHKDKRRLEDHGFAVVLHRAGQDGAELWVKTRK